MKELMEAVWRVFVTAGTKHKGGENHLLQEARLVFIQMIEDVPLLIGTQHCT